MYRSVETLMYWSVGTVAVFVVVVVLNVFNDDDNNDDHDTVFSVKLELEYLSVHVIN